ncbi:hypothetical protein U1Q18_045280, partial [Sarracenia purpurea var. burkii]
MAVIMVDNNYSYDSLVTNVKNRWRSLQEISFFVTYFIPGHSHCMLDNDGDFKAMLALMGSVVGTTIDLNIVENTNGDQLVDYHSSSPDGSEESIVE